MEGKEKVDRREEWDRMKKKKIEEIQNCLEQDAECKESGQLIFERENE